MPSCAAFSPSPWAFPPPCIPFGARAETLEDALIETYNTNPQILAERANLRAVDEGVSQALGGWRPTVAFTATAGREKFEATPTTASVASQGMTDPRSLNLVMTQPLYQGGQTVAKTAQAEDSVKAERAHLIATEGTVLFSVISAYLDVVRDQSVVELDKLSEDVLSKTLDQTRAQFRVGILTRTDVSQAEARLAAATAQRQVDEGTLQSDRANYARFVGHLPGELKQPSLRPAVPMTRDEALGLAAVKNPNVISALFTEEASRDFVTATEAQLLPSLNLVGQVNRTDDPNFLADHEDNLRLDRGAAHRADLRGGRDLFAKPPGQAAGRPEPAPDRRRAALCRAGGDFGLGNHPGATRQRDLADHRHQGRRDRL